MAAILPGMTLTAAARSVARTAAESAVKDSVTHNDSRRYDCYFLEAVRQQNAGNYASALDLLNRCIAIRPDAAEAYYLRSSYFAELNDAEKALADMEKAAALSPGNDYYQEGVAQHYIGSKDYRRAIEAYEQLYSQHHGRSDILNVLKQLYRQEKDYAGMLRSVERMEQADGQSDETVLAKMNVYEMMGEKQKARGELQRLVGIHPNDATYKVMLGNWLLQNGEKEDAHRMFSEALEDDPENETAQSSMYDYYASTGQDSLAKETRDRILLNKKVSTQTRASMIFSMVSDNEKAGGDSTAILKVFDDMMRADTANADIALLKASYMERKGMPSDSLQNAYAHVLSVSPDNAAASLRLIQLLWARQRWDDVISASRTAVQYNPGEMAFYYFLGLAHYQKKDEDAALDAFERGIGEISEDSNPDIVSDFYAIMGDIMYSKKQPDEAFAAYENSLKWKQDNIMCLNNYAYYLSTLGRDLRKAEQMSYKAVKEEPNNSTYLDTYAWILYMQDKYSEARVYIDQALAVDTDSVKSAVVLEHAGDIYAMSGNRAEAESLWQRAIEAGGDKAALRKKISRKKFVKKTIKH